MSKQPPFQEFIDSMNTFLGPKFYPSVVETIDDMHFTLEKMKEFFKDLNDRNIQGPNEVLTKSNRYAKYRMAYTSSAEVFEGLIANVTEYIKANIHLLNNPTNKKFSIIKGGKNEQGNGCPCPPAS